MQYTINQLAHLAHVSVRTLHHYDEIGLLSPMRNPKNEYRIYSEYDLLLLQQILFFKELGFALEKIKSIICDPAFDIKKALHQHRDVIIKKRNQIDTLLLTIDNTIQKMNQTKHIHDSDLYDGFTPEEQEVLQQEAKIRWGHADQYKQSVGKYESLSEAQKIEMKRAGEELLAQIVGHMHLGPRSKEVQDVIQQHHDGIRFFYEPTPKIYKGLADMYVLDPRFRVNFEKYHIDLPEFMRDAMYVYADRI